MSYQHPGHAFLAQHGPIQREADLSAYVGFLLESARLDGEPPVDLGQIYRHFEMPLPQRAPLTEQQGVLVDGDRGLILIKADDPAVRQRFTEGHELMELLFEAQEQAHQHPDPHQAPASWQVQGDRKEQLCDRLAAELLMPRHSFRARLSYLGCSMATAKTLASDYQTSLLATLLRMMQVGEGAHGLVVWRLGWATAAAQAQGREPPQLRVWWRATTVAWSAGFPRPNAAVETVSVEARSVVQMAEQVDQFLTGTEFWQLGAEQWRCHVEALPLKIGKRRCVVSLCHNLG